MLLKKILWTFKRHPFLYTTRFKLLSKNSSIEGIENCSYNNSNKKDEIPRAFFKVNEQIFNEGKPESDLEKIKQISIWLLSNIKGGPGLSEASEQALHLMLEGKGGVCSDMAQIFNNFCVINDLKVREWGSTRIPFDRDFGGHSFNEVYCKELKKWVLIDVYYCVLFYHNNDIPLSVIELYHLLRTDKKIKYDSFLQSVELIENSINNNFLNPKSSPFLVCNYSNKRYDNSLRFTKTFLPVFVIHFLLYIANRSYHYKFPLDDYRKIFSA